VYTFTGILFNAKIKRFILFFQKNYLFNFKYCTFVFISWVWSESTPPPGFLTKGNWFLCFQTFWLNWLSYSFDNNYRYKRRTITLSLGNEGEVGKIKVILAQVNELKWLFNNDGD
jgi:hypothetical protein